MVKTEQAETDSWLDKGKADFLRDIVLPTIDGIQNVQNGNIQKNIYGKPLRISVGRNNPRGHLNNGIGLH